MKNTYTEMKNSGVVWLGNIPRRWQLTDIGSLYTQRNERVSDKDYAPLSVTKQGILPQLSTVAKTDDGDNRKLVKCGDFVINSRSDRRGACGISPYDGSVSLINTVLSPRGKMHPGYFDWLFHTEAFADEFYKWGHGIVDDLWTTRWAEMKQIVIPVPEFTTQAAIAAYLDDKCGAIDEIIAEAKASIEEYKAWKSSVIFEAVTKGLNPHAEMKDSGVEWIGKVPKHWKVVSLKRVSSIQTGNTPSKQNGEHYYSDTNGTPWIKADNLGTHESIEKTAEFLTERGVPEARLNPENTVYVCCIGTIGKTGFSTIKCTCNQQINAVIFNKLMFWKFGFYSILSQEMQHWFYANGNVLKILNTENQKNIKISLPPMAEQHAIVTALDKKCATIAGVIAEKEALIADMEAYKKSLIFETVTGKRKVC